MVVAATRADTSAFPIMWNRLIALAEEQAQVLIRTAFSPMVRSCGDVSVGIFDIGGRMLAQAVTGTPGHVNTMAEAVGHFIRHFPIDTMKDGDVYITNDPWLGTGHLNDFVVLTPCFLNESCVAMVCSTSHQMDVGGLGASTEAQDVFMEGLCIPMSKLFDQGAINITLIDIIKANSRLPLDTIGDTYSLAACNDIGVKGVRTMFRDFRLASLTALSDHIVSRSREAVLAAIATLPKGSWSNELTLDGYDAPLVLRAELTIAEDGIRVDLTGSAGTVKQGINVPLNYATAYAAYGVRCAIANTVPNNAGSLSTITVTAPADCILNAQRPLPVGARHIVGQMLPDLIFGCLAQAIPESVPAEGASAMWAISLRGTTRDAGQAQFFALSLTTSGGTGARHRKDGLSATAFPSGIQCMSVELAETQAPVLFWRKELRTDSGGPGETRGGMGQVIEVENGEDSDMVLRAAFDRIDHPARGRDGGSPGAPGYVGLSSGEKLSGKGFHTIPKGARLIVHTPGGGGIGDPAARSTDRRESDLKDERVSSPATPEAKPASKKVE